MQPGFIEDEGGSAGFLRWIPGALEKGVFGGARKFLKERVDVHAFRCTACGLLALYAQGSPADTVEQRARMARQRAEQIQSATDEPTLTPPSPSPFTDQG
jgi:hypothetical protein